MSPTAAAATAALSFALSWQTAPPLPADHPTVAKARARIVGAAITDGQAAELAKFKMMPALQTEGRLPTDAQATESREARKKINELLQVAMCARFSPAGGDIDKNGEEDKITCTRAAGETFVRWAGVIKPSGNPINDAGYYPLVAAADMILPLLNAEDAAKVRALLLLLIKSGDEFYAREVPSHAGRRLGNWMTWRLTIRAMAATVLGDENLLAETRKLADAHALMNLEKPEGWRQGMAVEPPKKGETKPHPYEPKCDNQTSRSEPNYGGYDFRHRDALLYHAYNQQAWLLMAGLAPAAVSPETRQLILRAHEFLQPYALKKKPHVEFKCSTVPFDLERRKAGLSEFQNTPWDPEHAKEVFRIGRLVFPETREWTEGFATDRYAPWLKFWLAMRGDRL